MSIRVRPLLDQLKATGRRPLVKLLPDYDFLPDETSGLFPSALLNALARKDKYSIIGLLSEHLVLGEMPLELDSIWPILAKYGIILEEPERAKVAKSKTTRDYFAKLESTRDQLHEYLIAMEQNTNIELEHECIYECVEGHPDGVCGKTVIEVKTTGKLEDNIEYFMLQLCSYVAMGDFNHAILVLPLQSTALLFDMTDWTNREAFRNLLVAKAQPIVAQPDPSTMGNAIAGKMMYMQYPIGHHLAKINGSLFETVSRMQPGIPFQIFLAGPQTSKVSIKDDDLAAASAFIAENNLCVYIHAPYIINLSAVYEGDNWHISVLQKILQYGQTLGCKGVVVHTGKHTKNTYEQGVEIMRENIEKILPYATPECPLLLETPAGQGTETLQGCEELLVFVASFANPAFAVCVDTCHVFANGHDPAEYLRQAAESGLMRLVHFNDSMEICGSCKDRHAPLGIGKIGIEKMTQMAEYCRDCNIDMVNE